MSLWHAIGRQLRAPTGLGGRLAGRIMRIGNERPNCLAIDALDVEEGDRVLELGFGPGHAIQLMAARTQAGKFYGIDQSAIMHAQALRRNRAAVRQGRVALFQAPFEDLPLGDASIDKVLAVNVIYFWRDVPAVLAEIGRVMRPNGRVSIYATDQATMRGWKFAGRETHRLYDAEALAVALREGPFRDARIKVDEVRVLRSIKGLVATIS